MQNIYSTLREKLPETIVPSFQQDPEAWALAMTLAAQKSLIGVAAWAEARNVILALQQGKQPTPAQEELRLAIRVYDLQVYRNAIKNSIPFHWSEIAQPTEDMKAQLKKSSGKTVQPTQWMSVALYLQMWNQEVIRRKAIDTTDHYAFYPEGVVFLDMGYAAIWFQVIYTGNSSLTINGISQIELKDKRSGIIYAGGTAGGDYGDSYFRGPVHVEKGESAYFLLTFDPGTWYDLNFEDLYDTNGDANCAIQVAITNHNAEAEKQIKTDTIGARNGSGGV